MSAEQEREQTLCKIGHELVFIGKHLYKTSQPDDALVGGAKMLRQIADQLDSLWLLKPIVSDRELTDGQSS